VLGYQPQDDAEAYAAEILATTPESAPDDPDEALLGGHFAAPAYNWSNESEDR
jgi:uronate dehydrogenase